MARSGFEFDELKRWQKKIRRLDESDKDRLFRECANALAARLLSKVIPRTPVGQYPPSSGKVGGTLRRGWTGGKEVEDGDYNAIAMYAHSLNIEHKGKVYLIEIINPVYYASYVEYGHRQEPGRYVPAIGKRLKKRWVKGKHFLKISEREVLESAPAILSRRIETFFKEYFG
ncbi:MAG: HK97 gp10 family phage protein [Firmicutes bacterium]|nr:HK97 gp10 family phage protein [Bacillota bacterium]